MLQILVRRNKLFSASLHLEQPAAAVFVYFLDWTVDAGSVLALKQEIGQIESKKAESSLYAPVAGQLVCFNEELLSDPSAINVDKYGGGWIFEMQTAGEGLLTAAEYLEHLASVWEVTQRTIKGQMNE